MSKKIDKGNYYYKKLVKYLKRTKNNPSGKFVYITSALIMKLFLVEKNDDPILLSSLNLTDREKEIFSKFNNKRIFENTEGLTYIDREISSGVMDWCNKYIQSVSNTIIQDSRSVNYKNAKEMDDNLLVPNENHSYDDVLLNLFYNCDIEYAFVDNEVDQLVFNGTLQTCAFNVGNTGHFKIIPTKYKTVCTCQTQFGECGNSVNYCRVHKHWKLTCNDSHNNVESGHTIKDPFSKPAIENRKLFHYLLTDKNDDSNKEITAYSLTEITSNVIKCNCVFVNNDIEPFVLILGVDVTDEDDSFEGDFLLKNPKNFTMINDVYESIRKYYKKHHNVLIDNKNKVIWQIVILQMLCKKFFNNRVHSIILGKSGTGKTFPVDAILPLFTFNEKRVVGSSITRNKFLGGPQNKNVSTFVPGYASSQEAVFLDEVSSSIQSFSKAPDQHANPIAMIKDASKSFYTVAIQGGDKVAGNATFILAGNLENMNEHVLEYKKKVRNNYKTYSNVRSNFNGPLFKSIEYYSVDKGNTFMAKAHAYARKNFNRDYLTGLEPAAIGRFSFVVLLEDDNDVLERLPKGCNYHTKSLKMFDTISGKKLHRNNFIDELNGVFGLDEDNKLCSIPQVFSDKVHEFFYEEFLANRNNFSKFKNESVNTHFQKSLINIITQLLYMDKVYWGKPLEIGEDDLLIVNDIMLYNFNSLSIDEAKKVKKPYYNDYDVFKADDLFTAFEEKNDERIKKELEEKKMIENITKKTDPFDEVQDDGE